MKKMLEKLGVHNREDAKRLFVQFIKFGVIGVSNTFISLLVYYVVLFINRDWYIAGHVLGWVISVANSFFWNYKFVFTTKPKPVWKALLKSYLSYGGVFILTTVLLFVQVEFIGIPDTIAPIVNLVISVPLTFLLNKLWTFK